MAFVVAGVAGSAEHAKALLLADQLVRALPTLSVRKDSVAAAAWPGYVHAVCQQYGWVQQSDNAAFIWREAGAGNPTAFCIGGFVDFENQVQRWYGISLDTAMPPQVTAEPSKLPLLVCITGAAGQMAYNLAYHIASGAVFGDDQPVILRLLDLPPLQNKMQGLQMEVEDGAFPLCVSPEVHTVADEAFRDVDFAILLSSIPREAYPDSMLRSTSRLDVLRANTVIFREHGLALKRVAKPATRVVVVANPANTNALIVAAHADTLPKSNFTSLSRLDQNRTAAQIAAKINSMYNPQDHISRMHGRFVHNVVVWGSHSEMPVPDVSHASVDNAGGAYGDGDRTPVTALVQDSAFLREDLVGLVQARGKRILQARRVMPCMSTASAVADHLRDLWFGTPPGEVTSMGVYSDGNPYAVRGGIFFSFPVRVEPGGRWTYVGGLDIDDELRTRLTACAEALRTERDAALTLLSLPLPKDSTERMDQTSDVAGPG